MTSNEPDTYAWLAVDLHTKVNEVRVVDTRTPMAEPILMTTGKNPIDAICRMRRYIDHRLAELGTEPARRG